MTTNNVTSNSGPVTIVIKRRVKPDHESAFEAWANEITQMAMHFEGYQGVNVIRPAVAQSGIYIIILRFASYADLQKWEESPERAQMLARSTDSSEVEGPEQVSSGLEFWFSPITTSAARPSPATYKTVIITVMVIYPLVTILSFLASFIPFSLPSLVRSFITVVVMVILMAYILMPRVTRLFSRWLYNS